ncbi:MAG TPA: peptide chain release factor 1 [candidate division Zixibacteria bacterium]|nr:peptide chain release factor 1 [candidate division Zixibacteria bacterium]
MFEIIKRLQEQYDTLAQELSQPELVSNQALFTQKSRELRRVEAQLEAGRRYAALVSSIEESKNILESSDDAELKEIARDELEEAEAHLADAREAFEELIAPRDPNDDKNAVMEIRAGTGGEEAALFAGDLYRMYQRYIEDQGWKVEMLSSSPSATGGLKEIIFSVEGPDAYGQLKFESGVHRVQRVPATETQGRIHTSAASVAVLPEAEDVDVEINPDEVKVDVYRSSGPGGQSVNTTDSAVRLTHLPTGLVVTCQDEKSQHKNKAKAFKVLRARLFDMAQREHHEKIAKERKSMVGSGDRSEKIRTYNFPQSRVTDHRIGLTLYKLDQVLEGDIAELIQGLRRAEREAQLQESKPAESKPARA